MVKQILNIPAKAVKNLGSAIASGAKTAMQPATPQGTWQFVLGAVLGAPVSSVYSFLYNKTLGRVIPGAFGLAAKILIPLVPIYFVSQSKIPFGNIINGALAGVIVAQGLNIMFGLFAGKMPALGNSAVSDEPLTVATSGFYSNLIKE